MARKDIEISYGTIFAKRSRFSRVKKALKGASKSGAIFSLFTVASVLFYLILGITPNLSYSSIESGLVASKTVATTAHATLGDVTTFNAKNEAVVEEQVEEAVEEPKTMAKVDVPEKTELEEPKNSYAGQPVYTAPANYINLAGRILPIYQNCAFQLGAYDAYVANCAGGYSGRYANFYYAHNSYGVFDILQYLGKGQTITIVKDGIAHNYVISDEREVLDLSWLEARPSERDRVFRANYSHSISLQTCYGPGASQRLYIYADEI